MNNPELARFDEQDVQFESQAAADFEIQPQEVPSDTFEAPEIMSEEERERELAARELGARPDELQKVMMTAEKKSAAAKVEAHPTASVIGAQTLRSGKVFDPDGRCVLDKMVAAGNVSGVAIRKQIKLESDLRATGFHASEPFKWHGDSLVTVTRLNKDQTLTYTNYKVDPHKNFFTNEVAFAGVRAPVESRMVAPNIVETAEIDRAETISNVTIPEKVRVFEAQSDAVHERGVNHLRESYTEAGLFSDVSIKPDLTPPFLSPKKEEIIDRVEDAASGITMTRYRSANIPQQN